MKAVLRSEHGRHPAIRVEQPIDDVAEGPIDRSRITDDADALAGDEARVGAVDETIDAELHGPIIEGGACGGEMRARRPPSRRRTY